MKMNQTMHSTGGHATPTALLERRERKPWPMGHIGTEVAANPLTTDSTVSNYSESTFLCLNNISARPHLHA